MEKTINVQLKQTICDIDGCGELIDDYPYELHFSQNNPFKCQECGIDVCKHHRVIYANMIDEKLIPIWPAGMPPQSNWRLGDYKNRQLERFKKQKIAAILIYCEKCAPKEKKGR